ncbi:MAG: microcin ABC transporter ATP-binding protein [Rhizobiales bacterium 65-9]|nr:ABC transporter ATP-binding protein [Hyphomicrobiales bacterium]OJY38427.1 MAG: microcin ABC transporter ATP-binding protein [Rhizobiales bacterium 65-9]
MESTELLSVRDLCVKAMRRGDREFPVRDVGFELNRGEVVCIVGESGSGKSVTANAILNLLPAGELALVKGSIRFDGTELTTLPRSRMRKIRGAQISMIFQEPRAAINPVERVGRQLLEVLEIHTDLSRPEATERALDALAAVKLPDPRRVFAAYPHELSGGQLQRIMIAQAMILDPAILIADEPTTALDVTTQAQILTLIKEMQHRRGAGVLFVTHDFGVVADIADRVVVMRHGEVVEQGAVSQVLTEPSHPYTRMLLDSVPARTPPVRRPVPTDTVLAASNVSKSYRLDAHKVLHALDHVSLRVSKGETLGIVGESGSGKTTLARCLIRLVDPNAGSMNLLGHEFLAMPEGELRPLRRSVQMVFQDPYRSLNPRRTVEQAITEGPLNFGMSNEEARKRARELIELVGLQPNALSRYPHQFSGGQRQRICIARALALEPALLIADEAVSALDVSVQKQVLELLDALRKRFQLAVIFITHDLRVAAQICDRVMVMHKGKVVEEGPTFDIFSNPQHAYTRELLGSAPGKNFRNAV